MDITDIRRRTNVRGELHHNAVLTDREVELLRVMHEEEGLSYNRLAVIFEISKGCVAKICRYERR